VVEAIADAATGFAPAPPFRPWCDPLPSQLDLGPLLARRLPDSGWPVVVGVLDEPTLQRQRPAVVDLDQGLLVVGAKGAGVSTTIRTLVAAAQVGGTDAGVVVLDGRPSHLDGLEAARVVEAVVPAGDVECLTRWIVALEDEATKRRRLRSTDEAHRCRILLVIHGFDAVIGSLADGGGGLRSGSPAGDAWVERLVRLVVDGSDIGISAVVTATRRGDVPVRVESALARRLVLRTTEPSAWADHGLVAADVHDLVPGRGHLLGPDEGPVLVQVARTDPSVIPAARPAGGRFRVRSRRLPDLPPPIVVPACPESATVVLGVADVSGEPVRVDVDRADFVVVGPAGSGRSTTLAVVAAQLATRSSGCPVRLFGRVSGALASIADRPGVRVAADGDDAPGVVVVDDVDRLDPAAVDAGALAGRGDVRLIGAVDVGAMSGFHPNPLVARLRRARRMLVLAPDDPAEFLQVTGVRWPVRPGLTFPPGRGVLLVDRRPVVVHVGAVPSVQSTR
jgi:S-DNA-T family DNA segregation ATPase FtsK/SpoIIIE